MKKIIYAGVKKASDGYKINYVYNHPEDLISIVGPQLYESIYNNKLYRFGYKFNDTASSKDRTNFMHSVNQIGDHPLEDYELEQFIKKPLGYLNQEVNLHKIDCMVYPLSKRSPLASKIVRCINDMTSHDMQRCSFDFADQEQADRFARLQGANILVVDDINTTGSTLNEILRKLVKINQNSNIYVYTLIGN